MPFNSLTERTERLVQDVWSITHSFTAWLRDGDGQRVSLLAEIAATNECAAAPLLLELLFDRSAAVTRAASNCLHELISAVPPQHLPEFAESIRDLTWYAASKEWRRVSPTDVAGLAKTKSSRPGIYGLASFHRNGYVREAAVHELDSIADGSELPFLLLRLNDWVEHVRIVARSLVQLRLSDAYLPAFARNLPLVVRLNELTRSNNSDILEWAVAQFVRPHHIATLHELIQTSTPPVGRACFQRAIQIVGQHQAGLIWLGLRSSDVVLRLLAARHARQSLSQADLALALALMEQDRFMPVRREALLTRIGEQPEIAVGYLEAALMDRNASIRELARFHLAKLGKNELAPRYRHALTADRRKAVALLGLGETGERSDLELVRPYLTSRFPTERSAAVRALGRLGGPEVTSELVASLPDDRAKVTSAARQGLEAVGGPLDAGRLWELLCTDARPHVRGAVVDLARQLGTWAGLPILLQASIDQDDRIASMGKSRVLAFGNRVFTEPNAEDRARIVDVIAKVKPSLDDVFLGEFALFLRGRGLG